MDYYNAIIRERGDATATKTLADMCRKKDREIESLTGQRDDAVKALKAVKAACGDVDNWHGETREFLLLVDAAIAAAEQKGGGQDG